MSRTVLYSVLVLILSIICLVGSEAATQDETLILYLPFDEGLGKKAEDKSQYGHHAQLINNYKWVDGKFGKAVEISGEEDTDVVKTNEADYA